MKMRFWKKLGKWRLSLWTLYCPSLTTLDAYLSQIFLIHFHKEQNYTQFHYGLRRNLLYCAISYVPGVCIVFGDQLLTNPRRLCLLGREVQSPYVRSVSAFCTVKLRYYDNCLLSSNELLTSHLFFPELSHRTVFLTSFYNCT